MLIAQQLAYSKLNSQTVVPHGKFTVLCGHAHYIMSSENWKVGDECYENGEKYKIKEIDFNVEPPLVIIQKLSDGTQINTQISRIKKINNNNHHIQNQANEKNNDELKVIYPFN